MRAPVPMLLSFVLALALPAPGCAVDAPREPEDTDYDVIIRDGTVYDGSGAPGVAADVGNRGDRIAAIGKLKGQDARIEIDASGLTVAPGFINMLSSIERARAAGLRITADMNNYTAGRTGLDAAMPPWVQEGGHEAWVKRLRDPAIHRRVVREMLEPTDAWENLFLAAGSPDNILFVGFKNEALRTLTGKTLAEVAAQRGRSPADTIIDLVIEDDSRVGTVYFLMDEENIKKKIALPWVSFGSDEASLAPEGVFMDGNPHPRGYGNFARLLGKYVRDEKVLPLPEALRRLTSLPAENLSLDKRGRLEPEYFADVVVFDPDAIRDHATFDDPHRYATGMVHVLVNGVQVLADGEHTDATPGRVVHGPGYRFRKAG